MVLVDNNWPATWQACCRGHASRACEAGGLPCSSEPAVRCFSRGHQMRQSSPLTLLYCSKQQNRVFLMSGGPDKHLQCFHQLSYLLVCL